jgi:hypothetical protein
MVSFKLQVGIEGHLQHFLCQQCGWCFRATAYAPEPNFTIQTPYREDDEFDCSSVAQGKIKHRLLFY